MESKKLIGFQYRLLFLGILNILDTIFTRHLVEKYGIQAEINPFVRYLIETTGMDMFAISKIAIVTVILLFVHNRVRESDLKNKTFKIGFTLLFWWYVILAINGMIQIYLL